MVEGLAEYREEGKAPMRLLINENTIKKMDPTFTGLPVYVHHVDQVDYKNIQEEADGFVVRSFFNKSDGKHWVEFITVTDEARDAIVVKKWKLSNAYIPKAQVGGGQYHGMDYNAEVVDAEYEHLAIVPNPRYAESIILTPEEFKAYNNSKEAELTRLVNSKEESKTMFKFFKTVVTKVENSSDLESMSVTLPKSKVDKTITQLINEADERLTNAYHCNGDEMVKVGDKHMSVNELTGKFIEMSEQGSKENASDEEAKKKALELAAHEEEEIESAKNEDDEAMENAVEEEEKKKKEADEKAKNELKEAEEKKKNALDNFNKIKNAQKNAKPPVTVELSSDKVARGISKYGSK